MAEDPQDNLIIRMLRDIRAKQDSHDARFEQIEQRFEEVHETMYTVAGFATHANVRHEKVTGKLKELERLKALEEKV